MRLILADAEDDDDDDDDDDDGDDDDDDDDDDEGGAEDWKNETEILTRLTLGEVGGLCKHCEALNTL